ncbi:MAG: hypothetical protein K9N55_10610 [Phycisphaerae bacterium]|nr:hypothetical protein [Phycisphaerae bacterium]
MSPTPQTTGSADTLDCRVCLSPQQIDDFHLDLLVVEVRLSKDVLNLRDAILSLEIQDITDGTSQIHTVYESQESDNLAGEVFSRQRPLGTISHEQALTTWTTMAQIDTRQLCFARQGARHLSFQLTLVLKDGSQLAKSDCLLDYNNTGLGYLDWQENRDDIRLKAFQVASFLITEDAKPFSPDQTGLLRGWLLTDIILSEVSSKYKRPFEKSFQKVLKICRHTELSQIIEISQDMETKTTVGQRQEIVEFCLHLIRLSESLSTTALVTLQRIAALWKINANQFSILLEKMFSIDRLQDIDPMVLLGMTEHMGTDQALKQLNGAYMKWNARVTHADKAVQRQADNILSWIAQARGRYQST